MPAVTAWIPLEAVNQTIGTLRFIPGSHKLGLVDHESAGGVSLFKEAQFSEGEGEAVSLTMEPGSVSFHHKLLIHGALPNVGKIRRIAVAQHYKGLGQENID